MSDSVQPHRLQPTRLPRPWDSPGKNTGVGCHVLLQCMKVKSEREVTQSCLTLPGSSIHGIFQAEYWQLRLKLNFCISDLQISYFQHKKRLKSLDFFQAEWLLGKITLLVSEIFETKEMCTIIWSLALTILKTVVPWYSRGIHFRTPQGYKNLWMLKSLR